MLRFQVLLGGWLIYLVFVGEGGLPVRLLVLWGEGGGK